MTARPPSTLYEWFAATAAAHPEATALEVDGQQLGYAELAAASERIAASTWCGT